MSKVPTNVEGDLKREMSDLQDYIDNATIALHWVDANGIIKWANAAELNMLGYTKEEYIGHHISEFHVDREKIDEILLRLSCNETLTKYESQLRCKDGTTKTVHIDSSVYWGRNGEFIHTRCFTIDITEQQRILQALVNSEARYKSLVNSLPAAVYTCDKDGRITFFNEVAVTLWGYRPDTNSELLKFCACHKVFQDGTFIPPEKTPMAVALKTGQAFRNVEVLTERPDGSRFYASVNIDPLTDMAGNITGAINIFQDITPIKNTELAVKASESRYRNLVHNLQTPLYTTDVEGRITLFNQAAVELWGREPKIGTDLWCGSYKIFNTDGSDLPLDNCPMAVCLKERRPVYGEEILVVRPDGTIRHVAPHPQPVFDDAGNMMGAINMLVDITGMKSIERALRESEASFRDLATNLEINVEEKTRDLLRKTEELKKSEERYHKMIDEVEDYAIILLDKHGVILNWNKGAEKIKGYKEEEITGKSFNEFYLPDDRKNGLPDRLLNQARETGKATHEGWRKRKDGSAFWGSVVLTALHDDNNNIIGFSKVTRDLTERKLSEDLTKQYMGQLEFQNKELEQFVYAASHDMKEPLRKIHLYNGYIAENPSNQLDNKSREYLSRSISAVERMKSLIDDLLTYSKSTIVSEGYEDVDVNKIIEEIMILHKEELGKKNGKVILGKLPVIKAVPFQIKQLLSNLINNSIKYKHPERPVSITIKSELVNGNEIGDQHADSDTQYVKISVIDNGIGFDARYATKIFEIFQRLNNGMEAGGSGIGLAICKKIVQNHDGIIQAIGKPNEGASFYIYLPEDRLVTFAEGQ